jgi:anti-sigma regulatory factor (Ser/Thr protein kinase)
MSGMAITATETTSLLKVRLPCTAQSVATARQSLREALARHDLDDHVARTELVASELVSNAIAHSGAQTFDLELVHVTHAATIAVIVADSSPHPPIRRDPACDAEHGRGLNIVQALSTRWGWRRQARGKAVYALCAGEE